MKPVKLDLSKLKHVKSDDKTTTLQHKDGHQITILHSALSKDAQAQLGALKGIAKDAQTPTEQGEARQAKQVAANPQSRSDKGFGAITAKPYAEGGDVKKPTEPSAPGEAPPGCRVVSSGGGYGKVILCDATGGQVPVMDAKHVKFCAGCGGPVKFADGGDVESKDASADDDTSFLGSLKKAATSTLGLDDTSADTTGSDPDQASARKVYNESMMQHPPETRFGPSGEAPKLFDSDKYVSAESTAKKAADVQSMHQTESAEDTAAENKVRAQAGLDPLPIPGAQAQAPVEAQPDVSGAGQEADASAPSQAAPGAQAPQAPAAAPHDAEGTYMQGMTNKLQGVQQQAEAQGQLGAVQAEKLNKMVEAEKEATTAYNTHFSELEKERQAHMQDIQNGHIDPNQYWTGDAHGNGGHSRMMAGIGMILAGFNPTTNPNAAIDYIKNQMDMNLKAQERNLSSKENLLSANLRQFGNLKDAMDMTRVMQHDTIANQLQAAAATAQSPLAKAAAMQAAGQIKMEAAPVMQNFAMRRAMLDLASGRGGAADPDKIDHQIAMISTLNPEQGKLYRDAFVPGVGLSKSLQSIPETVRSQIVGMKASNDLMNQSLQMSKQYGGAAGLKQAMTDPIKRRQIVSQAQTIQSQLIGQIKQQQHDGVYKPSEAEFLLGQIGGDPVSAMANLSSVPKIKQLQAIKQQEYGELLRAHNLPTQQLNKSETQDSQPQYKIVNGVKYTRGPNGEAIPVK